MFASIVSYGLAVGAVYALIGITYNVMFSASRVFSFTAGMLGLSLIHISEPTRPY